MPTAGATVHSLRLHAPAADSAEAARLRRAVRHWLADVAPPRYGLPAQAIVVVRRLQTRLPALVAGSPWPDPLAAVLRSSVRPALQPAIGAAVAAVWFGDEAELLACLARDALAARSSWWWTLLLGQAPTVVPAAARWCRAPTQVPRALQQLAAADGAAWLQGMGPSGRGDLLQALCTAFVVDETVRGWVTAGETPPRPARTTAAGTNAAADASGLPWSGLRTAAGRLQRLLLAVSDDAMAAASTAFAAGWCPELAPRRETLPLAPQRAMPEAAAAASPRHALAEGMTGIAPPRLPAAGLVAAPGLSGDAPVPRPVGKQPGPVPVDTLPRAAPALRRGMAPVDVAMGRSPRFVRATAQLGTAPDGAADTTVDQAFDTHFGGLFFLLNVALALGLYGDFTQPRAPGLAHTPWQFLHGLGRAWRGRGYGADALSQLLRSRAGAHPWPQNTPGWTLDPVALQAHVADLRPWHAVATPWELRLWHPAGFWLARRPLAPDAQTAALQALHDLGAEGHTLCWHGRVQGDLSPSLPGLRHNARSPHRHAARPDRMADLALFLRWRLACALGMPQPMAAVALTVCLPAEVQVTPGRLDLHFQLAALPLALRLAGLDRDPGWVPAAGCDFRFHFH